MESRIRAAGKSRGFAVSRLLTHWVEIVGDDISQRALPVKVGYGRGGLGATLTLLTTGANAPLVQMQTEKIRAKVNECYGYSAIEKVRITQSAPSGFAEGQVAFAHRVHRPKEKPALSDTERKRARDTVTPVQNTQLREALARLAENVITKQKS